MFMEKTVFLRETRIQWLFAWVVTECHWGPQTAKAEKQILGGSSLVSRQDPRDNEYIIVKKRETWRMGSWNLQRILWYKYGSKRALDLQHLPQEFLVRTSNSTKKREVSKVLMLYEIPGHFQAFGGFGPVVWQESKFICLVEGRGSSES